MQGTDQKGNLDFYFPNNYTESFGLRALVCRRGEGSPDPCFTDKEVGTGRS